MSRLGDIVRAKRKQLNMTGPELASKVGISQAMLSYIESGEKRPGIGTLVALARALECKVDDLVQ